VGLRRLNNMPKEIFENSITAQERILNEKNAENKNREKDPGLEVERIEFNSGIKMFLKGYNHPQKGCPTIEALVAINLVKRFSLELIKLLGIFLLLKPITTVIKSYNRCLWPITSEFILKYEFLTPVAQEIYNIVLSILTDLNVPIEEASKTSKLIAHVVQYDQAYRFRIQDLATETTKEQLANPCKELIRLLELNRQRDYKEVSDKIKKIGKLITFALYIPKVNRIFRNAIQQCKLEKMQFDTDDRYWASKQTDYRYFGK